jgi:hypothetical protein
MITRTLLLIAVLLGASPFSQSQAPATQSKERIIYTLDISGFALSESADGPQSAISWNEVDTSKFLHIHVFANVPANVNTLVGKYRKLPATGTGNPTDDIDLGAGKRMPGGYFDFVVTHFVLKPNTKYLVRVADSFSGDIRCVATHTFKTKP